MGIVAFVRKRDHVEDNDWKQDPSRPLYCQRCRLSPIISDPSQNKNKVRAKEESKSIVMPLWTHGAQVFLKNVNSSTRLH